MLGHDWDTSPLSAPINLGKEAVNVGELLGELSEGGEGSRGPHNFQDVAAFFPRAFLGAPMIGAVSFS